VHFLRQVELKVIKFKRTVVDANLGKPCGFLVARSGSVRQEASRMLSPPLRQVNGIAPRPRDT
jgi:hypothetical protein